MWLEVGLCLMFAVARCQSLQIPLVSFFSACPLGIEASKVLLFRKSLCLTALSAVIHYYLYGALLDVMDRGQSIIF